MIFNGVDVPHYIPEVFPIKGYNTLFGESLFVGTGVKMYDTLPEIKRIYVKKFEGKYKPDKVLPKHLDYIGTSKPWR